MITTILKKFRLLGRNVERAEFIDSKVFMLECMLERCLLLPPA